MQTKERQAGEKAEEKQAGEKKQVPQKKTQIPVLPGPPEEVLPVLPPLHVPYAAQSALPAGLEGLERPPPSCL